MATTDLVLVSHDHFDHCSPPDLAKLAMPDTVIAGPKTIASKLAWKVSVLSPGDKITVSVPQGSKKFKVLAIEKA